MSRKNICASFMLPHGDAVKNAMQWEMKRKRGLWGVVFLWCENWEAICASFHVAAMWRLESRSAISKHRLRNENKVRPLRRGFSRALPEIHNFNPPTWLSFRNRWLRFRIKVITHSEVNCFNFWSDGASTTLVEN